MTQQDLSAVESIEMLSSPAGWSRQAFIDELVSLCSRCDLVILDGEIAGFLISRELCAEVEILNLAVHPAFRRHGLGRCLLQFRLDLYEQAGAERVFLEVRIGNDPARRLYEGFGFESAGRRKKYYSDGEDALIMTQTLRPS